MVHFPGSVQSGTGSYNKDKEYWMFFSDKKRAKIKRFIGEFLNTRQELRGTLKCLPGDRIRVKLTTSRTIGFKRPIPITDAQHAEIQRLGRELCGKFSLTVQHLPHEVDARAFELGMG